MINSQSFSLTELLCNLDDDTQKCLNTIDQLPVDQPLNSIISEGRAEHEIEKPKDSTTHFGKLLEEYILTKHSDKIKTILNDDIESFSVRERDLLDSRFLITKYKNELHVRSIVFGSSEQQTPRTHYERLGLRLFAIIANYIKTNSNSISAKEPFDFIGKQFTCTYDGPNKERIFVKEFTPRVVEVDTTIEEESQSPQPKSIESDKIPGSVIQLIRSIKRTTRDIDVFKTSRHERFKSTNQTSGDNALWTRIMDIAYDTSNAYEHSSLVSLKKELSKFNDTWQHSSTEDTYYISSNELISFPKQTIWSVFISKLENM